MDNLNTARCGRHKAASSQTSEHESQLGLDGFPSPVEEFSPSLAQGIVFILDLDPRAVSTI
jgi:hypothetical protein